MYLGLQFSASRQAFPFPCEKFLFHPKVPEFNLSNNQSGLLVTRNGVAISPQSGTTSGFPTHYYSPVAVTAILMLMIRSKYLSEIDASGAQARESAHLHCNLGRQPTSSDGSILWCL